jgi:ribosomal protein S18 acetylase RimI-like enzyme
MIRPARPDDAPAMAAVGAAAGRRFAEVADPGIAARADDPPLPLDDLVAWAEAGRAWVAIDTADATGDDGALVGFVVVDVVDGDAHVAEVAVLPEAEGRGHGSALLDAVADDAARRGEPAVTLTTYRDVPWNRPFYERRGFSVLTRDQVGPELAAQVVAEAALGLDPSLRVCMRRPVARAPTLRR